MFNNEFRLKRLVKFLVIGLIIAAFGLIAFMQLALYTSVSEVYSHYTPKNEFYLDYMQVSVVDVGQGDGFVICNQDKVVVIDTGTYYEPKRMLNYLKRENINCIDALILTHPHQDHCGGLENILKNIRVENIYETSFNSDCKLSFEEMLFYIKYSNELFIYSSVTRNQNVIPISEKNDGIYSINVGDLEIDFLPKKQTYADLNNNSLVCRVKYNDYAILFTGDIEYEAEQDYLEIYPEHLKANMLKIPHHGSHTSCSIDFLKAVNPEIAIISCQRNHAFAHPHFGTVEKLREYNVSVYRTDEADDTIVLAISEDGRVKTSSQVGDYLSGSMLMKKDQNTPN